VVVQSIHSNSTSGATPSGMGIQFKALSEEALELIDKYVDSLLV
jgi:hypothetical protein